MEIKKLLKQYAFSLTVIMCLCTFAAGVLTVKEKTQYNMDMTLYGKIETEKTQDGIILRYDSKEVFINTDVLKLLKNALRYAR